MIDMEKYTVFGIDIGSTTVKTAILDRGHSIVVGGRICNRKLS